MVSSKATRRGCANWDEELLLENNNIEVTTSSELLTPYLQQIQAVRGCTGDAVEKIHVVFLILYSAFFSG